MGRWAVVFLVLSIVAGLMGFTGITGQPMTIDRVLFFAFVFAMLASMVFRLIREKRAADRRGTGAVLSPVQARRGEDAPSHRSSNQPEGIVPSQQEKTS